MGPLSCTSSLQQTPKRLHQRLKLCQLPLALTQVLLCKECLLTRRFFRSIIFKPVTPLTSEMKETTWRPRDLCKWAPCHVEHGRTPQGKVGGAEKRQPAAQHQRPRWGATHPAHRHAKKCSQMQGTVQNVAKCYQRQLDPSSKIPCSSGADQAATPTKNCCCSFFFGMGVI